MSKMPISWHQQNLHNQKQSLAARKDAVAREQILIASLESEINLRERQIAEAEMRGLDGFDADKLLRKRTA